MALDERHKQLIKEGQKLFTDRKSLEVFWQETALNFMPEVADFTTTRSLGQDRIAYLSTSYPVIARRTLGDSFSSLLRPAVLDTTSQGVWFSMKTDQPDREDNAARAWLEWATGTMRRAMYDRKAQFTRATKEGDHVFATFGNAPLSVQLNKNRDGLLFNCWHLKDVVWTENAEGQINAVWRKWKPYAAQLAQTFGPKTSGKVVEKLKDDPFCRVNCWHVVIETERYEQRDGQGNRFHSPWVSIWIDEDNQEMMEELPSQSKVYVIPRWVTIPGTQYASSPAVTCALPDARLIQAMTLTLLEASEKFADPPLLAIQQAIRSDISAFAGGITYLDAEYDERLGEAVRPLYMPNAAQGLNAGAAMRTDVRDQIAKAFFLDSLSLPPMDVSKMTAYEVAQRTSEWIRRAMPIFEPVEFEYNGQLCEVTFDLLMRHGAFGNAYDIPDSLRGKEFQFKFESPLHESADRSKGQKFLEAKAALLQAAELDQTVVPMLNAKDTLRDVLNAIGSPAKWLRDDQEMDEIVKAQEEAKQQQAMMEAMPQAAQAAAQLGSAAKDFSTAQQQAGGTPMAGAA